MKGLIISAMLFSRAFAFPQASPSTNTVSSASEESSATTIKSPEDVPQATSIAEVAALNVTIPVIVSSALLDSIPLNADDPDLVTKNPTETNEFLSPADFLTTGLSLESIPEVPIEHTAIGERDLAALFGLSANRGPFANFLQVATRIFINATKKVIK